MANGLNMVIAKTHQLSGRVVGMQLTSGALLGVALSMVQMSAGFGTIGSGGGWITAVPTGGVGVLLAVMIERLSLGGLAAVRVANESLKRLNESFYQLEAPSEREQAYYEQRKKALEKDKVIGWCFGGIGMTLSAVIGDVFWHHLFAPLGDARIVIPLSLACASVIGLNFIHAELFKPLMDMVLKAILVDHDLEKTAVVAQEQHMQINMMMDSYSEVEKDSSIKGPVKEKIKQVIGRRLGGFAKEVSITTESMSHLDASAVEGSLGMPNRQLALPAPRGKYYQHKAELVRLLRANPQLSQRDIAAHFSVSRSTANEWFKKLKAGA